ncbi:hypothetical protein J6590_015307 [Homalodisca vitripennis]|nr:hypothetical protein J6590_015307 [Homalodisca vitripennis]
MSVVVLGKTYREYCSVFISKIVKPSLYIIDYSLSPNLTVLDRCFTYSRSPKVVVISLTDSSVLELSSVYTPPRQFRRSSITEVMEHGVQRKTANLGGVTITAASLNYPPFAIYTTENNTGKFYGTDILLFDELAQQLNFTIQYNQYTNWGHTLANGSWGSGIGKAMQENREDVAVAHIWQIPSLFTVMDFGPSINLIKFGFLVRRPEKIEFRWQTFLSIFKPIVWFATNISLVLIVVIYHTLANNNTSHRSESWFGSFLTIFGHLTMTTSHSRAGDGSSRPVLTGWSVFSLLITSCLSSTIVSRLTLPLYSPRVDTIQQLVEQDYYWTVHYYARFTTDEMRWAFFNFEDPWSNRFEKKYEHMSPENVSEKASSDRKATFLIQIDGDDFPVVFNHGLLGHRALSMFRLVKQTIGESHATFGVRKNSPLLDPLTMETLRFLEVGLPKRWRIEVIRRWPIYDSRHLMVEQDLPTSSEPQPLQLNMIKPVFFLLLFGLALACTVFFVELSW